MTEATPETGPITFDKDGLSWTLLAAHGAAACGAMPAQVVATPADLAAAGFTSNAECARVLGDLQQAHLRELAEARAEVERHSRLLDTERLNRQGENNERLRLIDQLAAERAKRERLEEAARLLRESLDPKYDGDRYETRRMAREQREWLNRDGEKKP